MESDVSVKGLKADFTLPHARSRSTPASPNLSRSRLPPSPGLTSETPPRSPIRSSNTPNRSSPPRGDHSRAGIPLIRRTSGNLTTTRVTTPQIRRVSSNLNPGSPKSVTRTLEPTHTRSRLTPNDVAREYFVQDLSQHGESETEVAVILHNSCYGHRFSRPRPLKGLLGSIVERPERIRAVLLGTATAYVRLGERHSAGRHAPSTQRIKNSCPPPPFKITSTSRLLPLNHPAVTSVHGTRWMEELQIMCDTAESKLALNGKELIRPVGYGKDDAGNALPNLHEGDLYLCAESLAALQGCLGGVCDAVDTVFTSSTARRVFVCIRPPGHHCSSNFPSGFCWLNNVHVGIAYAAKTYGLTYAAILDFDLHHGDGSQDITWSHNQNAQTIPKNGSSEKRIPIAYYSLHDINSYPCEAGDEGKIKNASLCVHNAHGQSIWNVHLESWSNMEEFWQLYESKYKILIDKARSFLNHQARNLRASNKSARGAIFLSAGFDASQWEGSGMQRHHANVATEFYARFTRDVVALANDPDLGVDGRVVSVLEGGYSDRALISGTLSHLCGLTRSTNSPSSASNLPTAESSDSSAAGAEAVWWSKSSLEALELVEAGILIGDVPKKTEKLAGNYSSPTQASTARMTDHARERQLSLPRFEPQSSFEEEVAEPVPEVDWITASYELSRLLIPTDRQTLSYRHDELNAEATRARRERQSTVGLPAAEEPTMQLRTRKPKLIEQDNVRTATRTKNRRTTITAPSDLSDALVPEPPTLRRPRRRSSAASSILSSFSDMKLEDKDVPPLPQRPLKLITTDAESLPKRLKSISTRKASSRQSSPAKPGRAFKQVTHDPISSVLTTSGSRDLAGLQRLTESHSSDPKQASFDIDELASQMKKINIKLKVPTLEQHYANQEKAEQEKQKAIRAPRKPPVPKLVRTKPPAVASKPPVPPNQLTFGEAMSSHGQKLITENQQVQTHITSADLAQRQIDVIQPERNIVSHDPTNGNNTRSQIDKVSLTVNEKNSASTVQSPPLPPRTETRHESCLGNVLDSAHPSVGSSDTGGMLIKPTITKATLPVFTASSPIPFSRPILDSPNSAGKQ